MKSGRVWEKTCVKIGGDCGFCIVCSNKKRRQKLISFQLCSSVPRGVNAKHCFEFLELWILCMGIV